MADDGRFNVKIDLKTEGEEHGLRGILEVSGELDRDELGAVIRFKWVNLSLGEMTFGDGEFEIKIDDDGPKLPLAALSAINPKLALAVCVAVRAGPHILKDCWDCYDEVQKADIEHRKWVAFLKCVAPKAWDMGLLVLGGLRKCATNALGIDLD